MPNDKEYLAEYYARRAEEYDATVYKPAREPEMLSLQNMLKEAIAGRDILEIACGTGFLTEAAAETARSIVATDVNEEMLAIAAQKLPYNEHVKFVQADAYTLDGITGNFTAAMAAAWFSHIPKSQRMEFFTNLHSRLQPGSLVVMIDNTYVEGVNNPLADYIDDEGNTYSSRKLKDGSDWQIVKNFPTEDELRQLLNGITEDIHFNKMTYYWWLSYRTQI